MTTVTAIRNSFEAAAGSYDRQDGIQPEVARRLLAWLPAASAARADGARILEVGCGTGYLTALLRERYPQSRLCALDLSPAMVALARRRLEAQFGGACMRRANGDVGCGTWGKTVWHAEDVRTFEPEELFDLIASSSVLHWVQPLPETLVRLAGWLAPGGQLVCALMTEGTLAELHLTRKAVAPGKAKPELALPTAPAVVAAVQRAGLRVRHAVEREMQVRMPSSLDLMRLLGGQGVAAGVYGASAALNRTELARLRREYDRVHAAPGGGVTVTWRALFIQAENPYYAPTRFGAQRIRNSGWGEKNDD